MAQLTMIRGISSNEIMMGETVTIYFDGSNGTIYIENNDGDVDVLHTIESNDNGQYSFIPSHSGTFSIYTDKVILHDSVTLTVIPTLNGALEELGERLATNLQSKGVTASANDGLTTLANKILNIVPTISGIELDSSLTLIGENSVVKNHSLTLSGVLSVSYDDTSASDVDLSGFLQGATVTLYDSNDNILGNAISGVDGSYSVTFTPVSSLTVYTHFEGTDDYTACSSVSKQISFNDANSLLFSQSNYEYKSDDVSVTLELGLNYNGVPIPNVTLNISGSDGSVYSCVTGSDGVGSVIVDSLVDGTVYTATYNGLTANCTLVERSDILFYDACDSADGLSNYGTPVGVGSTISTNYTSYNSTENAYDVRTNGDWGMIPITAMTGQDNYKISMLVKTKNSNGASRGGFGFLASDSTNVFPCWKIEGNGACNYTLKHGSSEPNTKVCDTPNAQSTWYKIELIKIGTSYTCNVYDSNDTLLGTHTTTVDLGSSVRCGLYRVGGSSYGAYVKEIKAEIIHSLIYSDVGSSENLSNYESIPIHNTSGVETIAWDSTENAYKCSSSTDGQSLVKFNNITNNNYFKMSADIKLTGSSWANNGILGFVEKTNSQTGYNFGGFVQGQKYYRIAEWNGSSELQSSPNTTWSSLSTSDYNHHELIYEGGVVTYTLTNPSGTSKTVSLTAQGTDYIDGYIGLWVDNCNSDNCWFKNVIIENIDSYKLKFTKDIYTYLSTDTNIPITISLIHNGEPVPNKTITITDNSNTYTVITDNNGMVTFNAPLSETTYTATYDELTATCTTSGLTIVEYLQSTGSQYINTGYILKSSDKVEVSFSSQADGSYEAVFGARKGNYNNNAYVLFDRFGGSNKIVYNRSGDERKGNTISTNVIYDIVTTGKTCTVSREGSVIQTINTTGTINDCVNPCGLFCINTSNGTGFQIDTYGEMKIYSFKITDSNDNVIMELLPVRINDVGYMYDLVTETLLTNVGTFEYGQDK